MNGLRFPLLNFSEQEFLASHFELAVFYRFYGRVEDKHLAIIAQRNRRKNHGVRREHPTPKITGCLYLIVIVILSNYVRWSLLTSTYSVVTPKILPNTKGTAHNCHQGASGATA